MLVQTVAFWDCTITDIEPQVTISRPANLRSDEDVIREYNLLAPPMRRLIQKSRINIKDGGTALPYDWMHGNGKLSPTMCMFRDLGQRPSSAHRIARYDKDKPHGPGNSFWTAIGRPPREVKIAGKVVTLKDAARLAGVTESCVANRMKSTPIECVVLTAKHNRTHYPYDDAVTFLKSIDLYSEDAIVHCRRERERWSASLKQVADRTLQQRYATFCSKPMVQRIFRLLELQCPENDKIRLLAYFSAPEETQQSTRRIRAGIIRRCTITSDEAYPNYGGRGICVDARWINGDGAMSGLQCFIVDVGIAQPGLELDRIDNDGNYERSNCRWVTRQVNARNAFRAKDIADRLNAMVQAKVDEALRASQ